MKHYALSLLLAGSMCYAVPGNENTISSIQEQAINARQLSIKAQIRNSKIITCVLVASGLGVVGYSFYHWMTGGKEVGAAQDQAENVPWTRADRQTLVDTHNLLIQNQTRFNKAISIGSTICVAGLGGFALSRVFEKVRFLTLPQYRYEHIVSCIRSTSMTQWRELIAEYIPKLDSKKKEEFYKQAFVDSVNKFMDQLTTMLGYMQYRELQLQDASKQSRSIQARILKQNLLATTNNVIAKLNLHLANSNAQERVAKIKEELEHYMAGLDRELQRFLLLEDHPTERDLSHANPTSQEDLMKAMMFGQQV